MIHKPLSTTLTLLPSAPLTSGGSLDLANGQIGLFQQGARTARGVKAISNVSSLGAKDRVFLEVGTGSNGNRGALTTRNIRTIEFRPEDVLDISFKRAEKRTKSKVAIGYDGHNPNSNISLKPGQKSSITVELKGDPLALYGLIDGAWRQTFTFDAPHPDECEEVDVCDPIAMKAIIEDVVKTMKNTQIHEGLKLKDFMKIHPIFSDEAPTPSSTATFYSLSVLDNGDDTALGLVQATVPGKKVIRVERNGIESVYQIVSLDGVPSDYTPYNPSVLTNCGDCPEDYTEQAGGYLYYLTVEDDGVDISNTFAGLVASVTDSEPYAGGETGTYNGVDSTSNGDGTGATFNVIVAADGSLTSATIVNQGTGYEVGDTITIAGDDLGGASPANDLTLTVATLAASSSTKVGQSHGVGTYAVVYSADLTDAQKETILSANSTTKFSFEGKVESVCTPDNPASSIAWVEGEECDLITEDYYIDVPDDDCGDNKLAEIQAAYPNLTITVDGDFTPPSGSCITRYTTSVISNVVCDECFPDMYITEAPSDFGFDKWVKVEGEAAGADVKVGIYFEPLDQFICPEKAIADQLQTMVEPLEVQVTGGQLEGTKVGYSYNKNEFPVKRFGRAFRGSGYGVDYMCPENVGLARKLGLSTGNGYVENHLKDMVSKLEPCEQYDAITLHVKRSDFSNSFSNKVNDEERYIFVIPQGTDGLFRPFFNSVAAGSKVAGTI